MKPTKNTNNNIKTKSFSEKRLIKLQNIRFQNEAQQLRKQYQNKQKLSELKLKVRSNSTRAVTQGNQDVKMGQFLKPTKIISVTAHKWVIFDYFSGKYLRGYRAKDQHQLSTFSKLLVFCAINTLLQKNQIDSGRFQTIVTGAALKLHPGQWLLKKDDIVSLQDLLNLLLIEDGSLYETILALNIGAYLQKKRKKEYYSVFDADDKNSNEHLKYFYDMVYSYCQLLKLENIKYVQCDPIVRKQKNKCSAYDVAILSIQCLKIPLFSSIIKKEIHNIVVKYVDSEGHLSSKQIQIRSHTLLNKFIPYFSVCRNWDVGNFMNSNCSIFYQDKNYRPIVSVLLGAYGSNDRQKDIQQVVQWYIKNNNNSSILQSPIQSPNKFTSIKKEDKSNKLIKIPEVQKKLKVIQDLNLNKFQTAIKYKNNFRLKTLN